MKKVLYVTVIYTTETAPEYEPVFTSIYQYYGNSLISFKYTQIIPETQLIALTETNYVPLTQAQIFFVLR